MPPLLGPNPVPYPKRFNWWFNPLSNSSFIQIKVSPNEFMVRKPQSPPTKHTFFRKWSGGLGSKNVKKMTCPPFFGSKISNRLTLFGTEEACDRI